MKGEETRGKPKKDSSFSSIKQKGEFFNIICAEVNNTIVGGGRGKMLG